MRKDTNWQAATAGIRSGAAVAFLLATVLLFLLRLLPPWQWLLLALSAYGGIALVVRQARARRQGTLQRIFGVDAETAGEVIDGVLREKGLPFRRGRERSGEWFNVGQELAVYVEPVITRTGFQASQIQLRPVTAETRPLVESLTAKLDEAFAPRGAGG